MSLHLIQEIIQPETELENKIIADQDFVQGAIWGKTRNGHPEGQVIYHIGFVLKNIDRYSTFENREKLRLIAIVHDSFKYKVDDTKSKSGENHHGWIARKFAERYIIDNELLEIIELHDEAYNSWHKGEKENKWGAAVIRAKKLIERLGQSIDLYLSFYQCDNETGNKETENFIWFKNQCGINN